jgi:hypothetical protein
MFINSARQRSIAIERNQWFGYPATGSSSMVFAGAGVAAVSPEK